MQTLDVQLDDILKYQADYFLYEEYQDLELNHTNYETFFSFENLIFI